MTVAKRIQHVETIMFNNMKNCVQVFAHKISLIILSKQGCIIKEGMLHNTPLLHSEILSVTKNRCIHSSRVYRVCSWNTWTHAVDGPDAWYMLCLTLISNLPTFSNNHDFAVCVHYMPSFIINPCCSLKQHIQMQLGSGQTFIRLYSTL